MSDLTKEDQAELRRIYPNQPTNKWETEDQLEYYAAVGGFKLACAYKDKRIAELENDNSNAKALIGDLIQAALNDCVESLEWNEVEERVRVFLGDISEEREDD